jgi:hypothetical protein
VDEKIPECWYDGNTSESDTEGHNEISQNRLNKMASETGEGSKRRKVGTSGKPRKISLKLPEQPETEPKVDATESTNLEPAEPLQVNTEDQEMAPEAALSSNI